MPTARGWVIAVAGVALWIAGRAFGAGALEQLGFGLLALVVLALLLVRRGRHELEVTRTVLPARTQAGREVTVTLSLHNAGLGPAPVLLLEDRLPARLAGRARFALGAIESTGKRSTHYKVRPARRGSYEVGPLEVGISDPFGVARRSRLVTGSSYFLVQPRIHPLTMPREDGRRKVSLTSVRRQPTGSRGEDFYTLREYVEGDDLRKIHWPATAKRGRYMIRQEETPWHARGTIILDDRAGRHDDAGWERAVEAAASLADLLHRSGHSFRLMGAIDPGIAGSRGAEHLHRCLDLLAVASPQPVTGESDPLLVRLAELEARPHAEGSLFVVSGAPDQPSATSIALAARRFRLTVVLSILPRHSAEQDVGDPQILFARAGIKQLILPPEAPLGGAWTALWSAGRRGAGLGGGERTWEQKPARV